MSAYDENTKFLRILTKTVGANDPLRFGLCIALGVVLQSTLYVAHFAYQDILWLKAASEVGSWSYSALALTAVFAPLLFRRPDLPLEVQQQLVLTDELIARGNFTEVEKRRIWRAVVQKYIDTMPAELNKPGIDKSLIAEQIKGPQAQ